LDMLSPFLGAMTDVQSVFEGLGDGPGLPRFFHRFKIVGAVLPVIHLCDLVGALDSQCKIGTTLLNMENNILTICTC
jgi:hypothetical protein